MPAKLVVVIGSLDRGGAETHLLRVLPRLDRERFDVSVLVLTHRGALADDLERQGIPVIGPKVWDAPRLLRPLATITQILQSSSNLFFLMARRRADLLHFFLPLSYLIGGMLAVVTRHPRPIMSRRSMNNYQGRLLGLPRRLERWLHHQMAALIGNSKAVVCQLIYDEAAPASKTHLVYNGISLQSASDVSIRQRKRDELGLSPDAIVLIIVANLISYKGHIDLLMACARLAPGNWTLLVVGADPVGLQATLEARTHGLGISENVRFLSSRSDVPDLLTAADIGVLASHEEGFSNAILEGMAARLPMVVTDVGGNAEAVIDGETGIVVPAQAPNRMAEALHRLIADPQLRVTMGRAGRRRLEELFSIDACVHAYERLYMDVLTTEPRRRRRRLQTASTPE